MLRVFKLISIALAISGLLFSCKSDVEATENNEKEVVKPAKKTEFSQFSDLFKPISEEFELNTSSIKDGQWQSIGVEFIQDWLVTEGAVIEDVNNWIALVKPQSDSLTALCLAHQDDLDYRIYLLTYDKNENFKKFEQLGAISINTHEDKNEEEGNAYHFNITECESIQLIFRNDSLISTCKRYTAIVGQDWRVDQDLHVNDTILLPNIEKSFLIY